MSKLYDLPVIGIDVAADFSVATVLKQNGDIYRKNFRFNHSLEGFSSFLELFQKTEEELNDRPKVFCESTGIYHLTLLHFLIDRGIDIRVINPLITNSNKNYNIRKVKNDKLDSFSIARLCKFNDVKTSFYTSKDMLHLKLLVRDYYKIVDLKANAKKSFVNALYVYYPGLQSAFSDLTSKTPLAFITRYPTPQDLLSAPSDDVLTLLQASSRRGLKWAKSKLELLLDIASSASVLGINPMTFSSKVKRFVDTYSLYDQQRLSLIDEIKQFINVASFADEFNHNISLLCSFKGAGFMSAVTLLAEMNTIHNFSKASQLVAFFGVDPAVNESGHFKGDSNKMSKRGTAIGRRVLYALALASIRKTKAGVPLNQVLYEAYHTTLKGKKKKVRLVAIMNKLLRYIFSVLKNQKPYVVRNPKVHQQMFMSIGQATTDAA
ncbi:MAG TPA: IS110 family transposase [Clostridiales bacterium]|nr:IS110 family transposase [Clostridiales bacterium]